MFASVRESLLKDKGFFIILLIVYSAICYFHLNAYCQAPLFDYPIIDSHENIVEGSAMAKNGVGASGNVYFHSPFYIWVIAVLYRFSVPHPAFVVIFQFGLHFLNAFLLYMVALKIFSRFTARLSMGLFLFYGSAIFYASQLMNPTVLIFINLVLILMLIKGNSFSFAKCCMIGLVAGISFITRSDISVFLIFGFIWFCVKFKPYMHRKSFLIKSGAIALFFMIPLLFTGWMNYRKAHHFQVFPVNGFLNLYFGNNPDYKNTIGVRPGKLYYEIYSIPDASRNLPQEPAKYKYLKLIGRFVIKSPLEFIKCQLYKVYSLVNGYELPETFDIYSQRQYSPVLAALVFSFDYFYFPFGLLLPLAISGLIFIKRDNRKYMVMLIYLASYTLILVVLWNSSRYRMPMVPFLIVIAAAYIESMFKNSFKTNLKRVFVTLSLIILTNIPYDHFSRKFDYNVEVFDLIQMMYG